MNELNGFMVDSPVLYHHLHSSVHPLYASVCVYEPGSSWMKTQWFLYENEKNIKHSTLSECRWRVIFNIDEPWVQGIGGWDKMIVEKKAKWDRQEKSKHHSPKPNELDLLMIIKNRFLCCSLLCPPHSHLPLHSSSIQP